MIEHMFAEGVKDIRNVEFECQKYADFFWENTREVEDIVKQISERG